jgi:hypothetical protein
MEKITINLCHVVKGGVGKSVWTRMLCAYFNRREIRYLAYEANQDTPDLAGFYPEIIDEKRIFEFTSGAGFDAPNKMINDLIEVNVLPKEQVSPKDMVHAIVNMPSARAAFFESWLDEFEVLVFLEKYGIEMINWFVTTGDPDVLEPLEASIKKHPLMRHVIVRNEHFPQSLAQFPDSLAMLVEQQKIPVVNLPKIHDRTQQFVLKNQIPYEDADIFGSGDSGFGLIDQSALGGKMRKCFTAIDSTKIFGSTEKSPK